MIEVSEIKSKLIELIDKYNADIKDGDKKELLEMFDRNVLRIGVIGKMKAGKSSLLNALIFGGRVLPTGDKPVTVTLTYIEYGETDSVEVELMTESDIESLRNVASGNGEKAKYAIDLLKSIDSIKGGYKQYVSNGNIVIGLDELQEYVAADGKLSGIAKCVRIKVNIENLRGVTIIDTPGFNDPIESRGEATKNAVKECQILLFVHDYIDKYDKAEVEMLTEQIEYAGISEVIDIVNKADSEKRATEYDDWQYLAECFEKSRNEDVLPLVSANLQELMAGSKVIYVSSYMSLLGQIDKSAYDDFDVRMYNKMREQFAELTSKDVFHEFSRIKSVEKEINRISRKDTSYYLLESLLLKLIGQLNIIKSASTAQLDELKGRLKLLENEADGYEKSIGEINELIDAVTDRLCETSTLIVALNKVVNKNRSIILGHREEVIKTEFTESDYPNPTFGSTGVMKGNLSRYCTAVLRMDGILRADLDNLKKELVSECNKYIRDLIAESLTNTKILISDENRKPISNALFNIAEAFQDINIPVETERPKSYPDGSMSEKALYMDLFQNSYKDERIENDFLKKFLSEIKEVVDNFMTKGKTQLANLKKELEKCLNYSPEEKNKAINKLEDEIKTLEAKIAGIEKDVESLQTFKRN